MTLYVMLINCHFFADGNLKLLKAWRDGITSLSLGDEEGITL